MSGSILHILIRLQIIWVFNRRKWSFLQAAGGGLVDGKRREVLRVAFTTATPSPWHWQPRNAEGLADPDPHSLLIYEDLYSQTNGMMMDSRSLKKRFRIENKDSETILREFTRPMKDKGQRSPFFSVFSLILFNFSKTFGVLDILKPRSHSVADNVWLHKLLQNVSLYSCFHLGLTCQLSEKNKQIHCRQYLHLIWNFRHLFKPDVASTFSSWVIIWFKGVGSVENLKSSETNRIAELGLYQ